MRFLVKLLRHWYLYLIPVLILPVAGTLYAKQKLAIYETSALLYIYPTDSVAGTNTTFNQYYSAAQNGSDLINGYMQSNTFVVTVAASTDLQHQYDLNSRTDQDIVVARIRGDVAVTATNVGVNNIAITVDDKSPKLAQQIAQALINVTLSYFGNQRLALDKQAETAIAQQMDVIRAQLIKDNQEMAVYSAAHPGACCPEGHDPKYEALQTLIATDQDSLTTLQKRLEAIQQEEAALNLNTALLSNNVFKVLDPPALPLRPTLHLKGLIPYAGGGLAAALALIALIVGAQTLLDRKVYSTQDLLTITEELELDIPLMTSIPVFELLARSSRQQYDEDVLSGVLVPILTILPQSSTEVLNHEIRSAAGVSVADEG